MISPGQAIQLSLRCEKTRQVIKAFIRPKLEILKKFSNVSVLFEGVKAEVDFVVFMNIPFVVVKSTSISKVIEGVSGFESEKV